jgi:hypothetical protein
MNKRLGIISFCVGTIFGVLIVATVWFAVSHDFGGALVVERRFEDLIRATVVHLDDISVTIETANDTDYVLVTERPWVMERRVMGLWVRVPGPYVAFIQEGIFYAPHEAYRLRVNFATHPSMRGGHYRIRRAFSINPFVPAPPSHPDPVHEFFIPRHDVVAEFYWRP